MALGPYNQRRANMEVGLHAHMVDQTTAKVGELLRPIFKNLSNQLQGDYGGTIEYLWIDLELIEGHAKSDGSPRHPFRFQKRVTGRAPFGLPQQPDKFNVGHFSVRPDFQLIATLPNERAISYALSEIYRATEILIDKQKRLGGFDAQSFRQCMLNECLALGYPIVPLPSEHLTE